MQLQLKALAGGELTLVTLSGVVMSTMSASRRRRLLALASRCSLDGLDVVLLVDDEFRTEWCDRWTAALEVVRPLLSVRFAASAPGLPRGVDEG
jgi:hypothetical protein